MFSIPSHRSAKGVLLLITLISLSPVWSQDTKCADELNPFNIRPYTVPEEAPNEPKEQLALYLIAREDVGCAANHNDDLKKKVNSTTVMRDFYHGFALTISKQCQDHVKFWLDRIIRVVQHNVLVTLKVKAIEFFQPFETFKNFETKRQHITSMPLNQSVKVLKETEKDLKSGLILPGNDKLPSWEYFDETFSEILRVHDGINQAIIDLPDFYFDHNTKDCDNEDTQCQEQLYKLLIGESIDKPGGVYSYYEIGKYYAQSKRVLGYAKIRKILEDGVRVVRAAFPKETSERVHFDGLKLPMTPPCFST